MTDKRQRLTECERRDSWLQVVTAVLLRADDVQPSVRWWIILLAVLAGLVLLALLVLLMWKVRLRSVSVAFVITHLHLVMLFLPPFAVLSSTWWSKKLKHCQLVSENALKPANGAGFFIKFECKKAFECCKLVIHILFCIT